MPRVSPLIASTAAIRPVQSMGVGWRGERATRAGSSTREMCNWEVIDVGVDIAYGGGAVFRGGNRAYKQGQCLIGEDSGKSIYTVVSDGKVFAKGISGGGGGGGDNWGGLFDMYTVTYTDIRDPWLGLPGTIRKA